MTAKYSILFSLCVLCVSAVQSFLESCRFSGLIYPMKSRPVGTNAEEHLDYLVSHARLMLWYARKWALEHSDENFADVLGKRVDIFRLSGCNHNFLDSTAVSAGDSPEWLKTAAIIKGYFDETKGDSDSERFEQRCVELLLSGFRARVDRDLEDIRTAVDLARYQCGSLRYDLSPSKDNPQRIGFHIANACCPSSIFDDPYYLPGCFLALMGECEAKFGVTEIGTYTWLNSHPKWLEIFPLEWAEHMGPPATVVSGNYGFWGQFITARKTFNHKLARKFRETGVFPYMPRGSWCRIATMRKQMQKNLPII